MGGIASVGESVYVLQNPLEFEIVFRCSAHMHKVYFMAGSQLMSHCNAVVKISNWDLVCTATYYSYFHFVNKRSLDSYWFSLWAALLSQPPQIKGEYKTI